MVNCFSINLASILDMNFMSDNSHDKCRRKTGLSLKKIIPDSCICKQHSLLLKFYVLRTGYLLPVLFPSFSFIKLFFEEKPECIYNPPSVKSWIIIFWQQLHNMMWSTCNAIVQIGLHQLELAMLIFLPKIFFHSAMTSHQ